MYSAYKLKREQQRTYFTRKYMNMERVNVHESVHKLMVVQRKCPEIRVYIYPPLQKQGKLDNELISCSSSEIVNVRSNV